jgi:hypothetical protein
MACGQVFRLDSSQLVGAGRTSYGRKASQSSWLPSCWRQPAAACALRVMPKLDKRVGDDWEWFGFESLGRFSYR